MEYPCGKGRWEWEALECITQNVNMLLTLLYIMTLGPAVLLGRLEMFGSTENVAFWQV